jgi:hypothetical protein
MTGLSTVRGGNRLILLLSLASWSCLASIRLCIAKASRGDSSGGASPAMCIRGERSGFEDDEAFELFELDLRSSRVGRVAIVYGRVLCR